ncbi:MAG TPA: sigma-70 family RNA polymerase sigma factor [Candidatus Ruania gallistercoris]|uniref:Sigma-70 family RNA polymerase sigma factor n=1 Tax=Candidatus Ruania gallistercoris TaxID=2838746 RepID=A0A9D2J2M7_9MICO|nr:sigma-70 family RNA polymerase sigma factor [Candidatus Ruania gallistercoris]
MAHWEGALTELVRARGATLTRYATLLCGNASDGEDLVQEAVTKVFTRFRRSQSAEGPEYAEAYVRRAIMTLYLDSYRRSKRWRAVQHLFEPGEARHDESAGNRVDVARALTTLPPRQRACVVLRFYADLTIEQTGDELGLATGTVKRYLHEANQRLAAQLQLEGERA